MWQFATRISDVHSPFSQGLEIFIERAQISDHLTCLCETALPGAFSLFRRSLWCSLVLLTVQAEPKDHLWSCVGVTAILHGGARLNLKVGPVPVTQSRHSASLQSLKAVREWQRSSQTLSHNLAVIESSPESLGLENEKWAVSYISDQKRA